MTEDYPAYLRLFDNGELARRVDRAVDSLADCTLCGRQCHADRSRRADPKSYCHSGRYTKVNSVIPHHGEEDCLRGSAGSGTIFFTHCSLRCIFCQNFDVSIGEQGRTATAQKLAKMMLGLQSRGCHNINLVTPSHVVPQILEGLLAAAEQGLRLPVVYNTGGYDHLDTLRLLDGVVDIYMPDLKFWDEDLSRQLANAADYREVACRAVKEMHRQVGDMVLDEHGVAQRGLLVRHLVLPDQIEDTRHIMRFIAREISPDTLVNVMSQYRPEGYAARHRALNRSLDIEEYREALAVAEEEGLRRVLA